MNRKLWLKPIKVRGPLSRAVTIFAPTGLIPGVLFRFFCLSLTSYEFSHRNLPFVDCFRLLSDRLGDFARSSRSHIFTQAQIASECFVDALLELLLARKLTAAELITSEFNGSTNWTIKTTRSWLATLWVRSV